VSENKDNPTEETVADEQGSATVKDDKPVATAAAENKDEARKPAPSVSPPVAPTPKGGSSLVGWLALLLVLALAAAAGWSVMQGLEREKNLQQRIVELEAAAGGEMDELRSVERKLQAELNAGLQASGQATRSQLEQQTSELAAIQARLDRHSEQMAAFSANDQESWLRAEAQYLLRLASQRVIMAGDTESALALLDSADSILRELDDTSLYPVRRAVAAEKAALRAVPRVDVEGIYLRLSALIEQADILRIFQMPEQEAQPEREPDDNWQVRLERGYEQAARKLSDYIVIRRREVPMQALMDPQWEGLVRQNMRMLLEQAQVALLSGNQSLYEESLQRAQHWVSQFLDTDEATARAMLRELTQLEGQTVQVKMPDMNRSLQALDEAMKQRLQQGGAE